MSSEFTGERVIPGQVDVDLWNEHYSRYLFAARLAPGRRVLDLGCGAGYGSHALAASAAHVTGIDLDIAYPSAHYHRPNLTFTQASATALPFAPASFDLIVAFEVIEHLADWQLLLTEARRVLAPGGQLLVSTPNRLYYAESRQLSGPNPFHVHEFEFAEFETALAAVFPAVEMYVQNHTSGIAIQPAGQAALPPALHLDGAPRPAEAHFFLALCGETPGPALPAFVHIPEAANVLREREHHIARLEGELRTKDAWLAREQAAHQELLGAHDQTLAEMKAANDWAQKTNETLAAAEARIVELQDELTTMATGYEAAIVRLESEHQVTREWAEATRADYHARLTAALARIDELDQMFEERTAWALSLDAEATALRAKLDAAGASKWVRLGRRLHLGPVL